MNVYEIVTNRIMELMQQGEIPWRKPWKSSDGAKNLFSKKQYRGINHFLLNCSPYSSPYWLTYQQATEKGGYVRKGEKSTLVVFWKWVDRKTDDEQEEDARKVPLLRYYNVFNLEQTGGIEAPEEDQIRTTIQPIERAEVLVKNMPSRPIIQFKGDRAFYDPQIDMIQLPDRQAFQSAEEYYSTFYHELCHATGHSRRLGRKGITNPSYFGSHDYSREELVAEFGASMLCGVAGIEQKIIENSAAYIQGWLKALRNDKKLAIIAAGQAQRAADYILDIQETKEQQN